MKKIGLLLLLVTTSVFATKTATVGQGLDYGTLEGYYNSVIPFDLNNADHVDTIIENQIQSGEPLSSDVLNAKLDALNQKIKDLNAIIASSGSSPTNLMPNPNFDQSLSNSSWEIDGTIGGDIVGGTAYTYRGSASDGIKTIVSIEASRQYRFEYEVVSVQGNGLIIGMLLFNDGSFCGFGPTESAGSRTATSVGKKFFEFTNPGSCNEMQFIIEEAFSSANAQKTGFDNVRLYPID